MILEGNGYENDDFSILCKTDLSLNGPANDLIQPGMKRQSRYGG
jgi:hypothetical protein